MNFFFQSDSLNKSTRIVLLILFACSVALKLFFVFATPIYMDDATGKIHPLNDEYPHLKYSLYLIEHREFPVNKRNISLEDPAAWIFLDYEYGQAPLYYALNVPFALFSDPMRMSRLFSVLLSSATLWLGVICIIRIFRETWLAAITTMALLGFHPVLVRIGSSVSNDNLAWLLSMILFWLFLNDHDLKKKWLWGALIGLGVLTKVSFLIWPFFLLMRILLFQRKRKIFLRYAVVGCVVIALCGWWLVRGHMLYGDWTGIAGGAGAPGTYLSSGSLDLIQNFADTVVRFSFFPIAEETPKYVFIAEAFALFVLISCFLQLSKLLSLFRDQEIFRDFLLFDTINLAAFLYPNLVWPYADGRLLFIGLLPIAAMIVAAFVENFRKWAPAAAMIANVAYLVSLW